MTTEVFRKIDAGAFLKGRDKGDCTVRALAMATGMGYGSAWQLLYRLQAKQNDCGFRLFQYLRNFPETMEVKRYLSFPAQRGVRRIKLQDFQKRHPEGSYIVQVAHHATAVVNGVCLDTWYPRTKTVYGAWEMNRR